MLKPLRLDLIRLPAPDRRRARSVRAQATAATDRAALVALVHAAYGPDRMRSTNWLTGNPLRTWR